MCTVKRWPGQRFLILQKSSYVYLFYIPFLNNAGVGRQCRRKQKIKIGGKRK